MDSILFCVNSKLCDMNDAIVHITSHSKLYFEVKFPINKTSFTSFPINGFVHISETGDKVQYRVRIDDIVPFSKDHYESPRLYRNVMPDIWLTGWKQNKNNIQNESWKYALVISAIDVVDINLSDFQSLKGNQVVAPRNYIRVIPPQCGTLTTTSVDTLVEDLRLIDKDKCDSTTKLALINARKGQGAFRSQVLQLWGNSCSVTKSITQSAIRASHIKPWCESTNAERLDPNNGLPLIANLDALFDVGLITFDSSGNLIASSILTPSECALFGIIQASLTKPPNSEMAAYLDWHRRKHGL